MNSNSFKMIFIILGFLFFNMPALYSQQEQKWFGQNKVQYQLFHWNFIQTEHFDVYFYKGGDRIARFAAEVAEDALAKIRPDFRDYELQNRISIILFNSHNQFQQNNVIDEYMPEGVGGVTELFKNRIVIPYEGAYEKFRHVIHHELTHGVMNDFMYGGSMQSLITGRIRIQIPLWFAEGYAEYSSRRHQFHSQSDMFVRDAVIEGYLPRIDQIEGYAAYTVGPTIFHFIEERYGKEKVAEFITKLRIAGTVQSTIESSFGMKLEEFSDKWALQQRKLYYPDIASMQSVKEIARQLTKHDVDKNFYNYTPTLSPDGDVIAFLSDRDGYADIFLMSATDGKIIRKLVSGEKTPDLEELHWLSPGMSWSPDGKKIVIAAKASDNDALMVIDVASGKIEKYKWNDLEGVFGGSFSPDGESIAFSGIRYGQSDVYVFNLKSGKRYKVTNDIFSDSRPAFSPDGQWIAFVSDRGSAEIPKERVKKADYDYSQDDIFIIRTDGTGLQRITTDPMNDDWPQWSPDGKKLIFTSDRNGVSNLYIADLEKHENYPITNNLSGIFQPSLSRDGRMLAFTAFHKAGFDIFTIKQPFEMPRLTLPMTVSMKQFRRKMDITESMTDIQNTDTSGVSQKTGVLFTGNEETKKDSATIRPRAEISFRNYIFADDGGDESLRREESESVKISKEQYMTADGEYRIRKYKVKFTPDIFYGAAGFNTLTGFEGTTQLAFSDILGNHRLLFGTNLFFDLKNSSYSGAYYYLSRRTDYGIMGFHTGYSFLTDYVYELGGTPIPGFNDGYADSWVRFRYYGISLSASRPFNKFNRMDFAVTQLTLSRETELSNDLKLAGLRKKDIPGLGPNRRTTNTIISTAFVTDNSLVTIFGPFDGRRAQIEITTSPGFQKNALHFTTVTADYRKYFWFKKFYAVATRVSAGATFGKNPQRFFVGGMDNWIAPSFTNGDILVDTFEDFLATFVTPLRGSYYYELQGTRYAIANFEFRFPLIYTLQGGFPLPVFLQQIRGVTFVDIGAAWGGQDLVFRDRFGNIAGIGNYRYIDRNGDIVYNRSKFNFLKTLNGGQTVFQDVRVGYGFGIRGYIGFFVLRYDLSWNIMNPRFSGSDAKHYFSIGIDY